ncbi:MAG: galactose mutarotase [Propionibacteriaceae bacterium]|jgi:aldose 1-epimerase|nr:galactose mutarotase [Propionibacteriaceae bacterium]
MEKLTLTHGDVSAEIWSKGACVNDLRTPDRHGQIASIVVGYPDETARLAGSGYLGEMCGPFANRIAQGGYRIGQTVHTPALNDSGSSTLHGGPNGWSTQDWQIVEADERQARLRLDWSDPDDSFPGPIHAEVAYRLDGGGLTHQIRVTSEAATVLSVVSHPYFNLSGTGAVIDDHELMVRASRFLPIDAACIPLEDAPWSVDGSSFDFRQSRLIEDALATDDPQVRDHGGIDHALILDDPHAGVVARLRHRGSGRQIEFLTNYPALQVYTGQYLDDSTISHPVGAGTSRTGIALETEEYPNAPRRPDFPSCLVSPGEVYTRATTWRLSTFD